MSDITKIWLENLYQNEIKEVIGTISNEALWLKGSADAEEMLMHQENINDLETYKALLEDLIKELNND